MRALLVPLLAGLALLRAGPSLTDPPDSKFHKQFVKQDRNRDGRVTREEFKGSGKYFQWLDWNNDGAVTKDELPRESERTNLKDIKLKLRQDAAFGRDVVFGRGGNRKLRLDYLCLKNPPSKPMPVLVWIHGGGWRAGNKLQSAELLLPFVKRGYFCVTVEYRLSHEDIFPAQIEDCKCAIRYLRAHARKYDIDPKRIGVWGSSAGGHLAALLGTTGDVPALEGRGGWARFSSEVQAVCDWFGPADLRSGSEKSSEAGSVVRLIGARPEDNPKLAAAASPITYVDRGDAPFLIVHGTKDDVVPYDQSVDFAAALRKAGVDSKLITVKGGGHGGKPFDSRWVRSKVFRFFEREFKQ